MRVNPNPIADLLANINNDKQIQETALAQLASGRRVVVPSDDPAAAAVLSLNHASASQSDQFLQVIGSVSARLQTADSTLGSVVATLNRAISLGIQGGGSTLSQADRNSIAAEIQGLQQQLVGLANTSFQDSYLFGGTADKTAPFVLDPTSTSGVRYVGNNTVNSQPVGEGFTVTTNVPGSKLFTAPGADAFQTLHDLATAVQTNTNIDTTVLALRSAFDSITSQRVFYGNSLSQLGSQQTYLNGVKLELAIQENAVGGTDPAAATTNAVTAATARSAALQATNSLLSTSLFNYLK